MIPPETLILIIIVIAFIIVLIWSGVGSTRIDEHRELLASERTTHLSERLKQLEIEVSLLELNEEQRRKLRAYTGSKSIIAIKDSAINYAFADYDSEYSSQGDIEKYYTNFIVICAYQSPRKSFKHTWWYKDKWSGEESLCKILNDDMSIKEVLQQVHLDIYIDVWPEHKYIEEWPEHQGFKIAERSIQSKTLPSYDLIRAIERIAKHLNQFSRNS